MTEESYPTSTEGLRELEQTLEQLEGEGRRDIAGRIQTAREWGDLKENSEYHDAKNEQAHLETRIARLREKISRAEIIEPHRADGAVGFGSRVLVCGEDGSEQTWNIVSSHEAEPAQGRLSAESPVARALEGKRVGEVVEIPLPRGARKLTIVSVE